MKIFLLLTVGGSHQPILRSIQQNQPDFVHFICSDDCGRTPGSYTQVLGKGKVLKSRYDLAQPDLPNIATLAGLTDDSYEVHRIRHFDNLNDCYLTSMELIEHLHKELGNATIIADYTGGTKSMTAGLAAAALDDGRCEIRLVVGERRDLDKTADKTEFVRPIQVWDTQVKRRMRAANELVSRFDYAGAARLLEETAARFASDIVLDMLKRWLSLCRAFDAWDQFDHGTARQLLDPYRGVVDSYKTFLALVLEGRGHGFELVEDLLLNAERRGVQGRYDDAVGRVYRAAELTAQIWLKQRHGIETANVDITLVPTVMRELLEKDSDEKGTIKIGLLRAWDLIMSYPNDSVGEYFNQQRNVVMKFLSTRNNSLFAHGVKPVRENDYRLNALPLRVFLEGAIERAIVSLGGKRVMALPQLPTIWE
jgi:CRISPR-associated protein (TIGR02710 family)